MTDRTTVRLDTASVRPKTIITDALTAGTAQASAARTSTSSYIARRMNLGISVDITATEDFDAILRTVKTDIQRMSVFSLANIYQAGYS
jgi:hypothetical protein